MSMRKWLFAGRAASPGSARESNLCAPSPGEPTRVDAVERRVAVAFHVHDNVEGELGNFLTAVTEGLISSRQRELVLTLRLGSTEDPVAKMRDIVRFVATVHVWASEGNLADSGGFTQFGERGLFGGARNGLLYADARPIASVRMPERALAAIFVDKEETRAALDYGVYRVLTRMGLQLRVFPYPTWGDLERASVITARESESLLARVARARAPGVSFVMSEQCLQVSIPRDITQLMRGMSAIPAGAPFVLLTRPESDANAILVFTPGQAGPSGISSDGSDGSRLSGSCLMIAPGAPRDQVRQFEDGYSAHLSHESWAVLSNALYAQRPVSLKMAEHALPNHLARLSDS